MRYNTDRKKKGERIMKTTKIIITATIITVALIVLCGIATATAEVGDRGEFYPLLTVVTGYEQLGDTDIWTIDCTDRFGRVWSFYGEKEDAHIGYIYNLLMWNLGETEEEDEVIEVYYEGVMTVSEITNFLP